MTTYRPPTRADIGRTVEVSMDNHYWIEGRLVNINAWQFSDDDVSPPVITTTYWLRGNSIQGPYPYCRVPYSSPDPVAELSIAADQMADQGLNEAARVLMDRVQTLEMMKSFNSISPQEATYAEFRGAYDQMMAHIASSLGIPKSLVINPPEPQP